MNITRADTRQPSTGPSTWFTGQVQVRPIVDAPEPARVAAASVTFQPGARTAWHTHPLGQTLLITAGRGWVQREGGERQTVETGDVVWFEPGEKHWHGATDEDEMTHTAVQEKANGSPVDWLEQVTDEQYRGA